MEKRRPHDIDYPEEWSDSLGSSYASREDQNDTQHMHNEYSKRARQRWIVHRVSPENIELEPSNSDTNSPTRVGTPGTFSIMGEDLNLLGAALNGLRQDDDASDGDHDDELPLSLLSSTSQMAEHDQTDGEQTTSESDETNIQTHFELDSHINRSPTEGRHQMADEGLENLDNTSEGPWDEQPHTRVVIDLEETEPPSTCVEEGSPPPTDRQQSSESDCEIIGVVPNQHGVVMNHRIVPKARRESFIQCCNHMVDNGYGENMAQSACSRNMVASHASQVLQNFASPNRSASLHNLSGCHRIQTNDRTVPATTTGTIAPWQMPVGETQQRHELLDDELLVGPIFWGPPKESIFPRDYHTKPTVSAYSIVDNENQDSAITKLIDDIEFLFRCPICYSTIARFKSAKMPNENDRVIYSTKCGHMYCFDCIEGVKKRRECPICRKPLRDAKQYHVIYP
ncbi:uncharacterized protein BXIN_2435 [Babesia sp. Xinjiang]|uniref:uncharacterized protein n=1 Tax=Babesia sp. Xinjiang TaxID=462227 RepID=UPI000A216B93|nr:uncharacterized protein BXIN_2435 [Babesia sp. Xinjiang]ORM41448.1 hypothetical protein BXIN_2435 [Babesia sp. Xinjiang]